MREDERVMLKGLILSSPSTVLTEPFKGGTEFFIKSILQEANSHENIELDFYGGDNEIHEDFSSLHLPSPKYRLADRIHSESKAEKDFQIMNLCNGSLSQYDFLHFNTFNPWVYLYGSMLPNPSLTTLHIPPNKKQAKILKLFANSKENNKFITVSQHMKDLWEPVLKKNVDVILNGVDTSKWSYDSSSPRSHFTWSGRIVPEKGLDRILPIFKALSLELKIVGPISNDDYFNERVKPFLGNHIEYLGERTHSELIQLYKTTLATINPGVWREPFGYTTIESISSGVPVIGSSTAIPKEFHTTEGVHIIEDSVFESELSQLLLSFEGKPSKLISEGAEEFNLKNCADKYINRYITIAESMK